MPASLTRCPDCWQPVNRCCCTQEEAERAEIAAMNPYVPAFPKMTGPDWFAEDRSLHRVQQEERDDD